MTDILEFTSGQLIQSHSQVEAGQQLSTQLLDGRILSRVESAKAEKLRKDD